MDTALVGFTNSDFAGYKVSIKFTYRYLFKVGGSLISWKLKRSSIVAYSTLEAEYTGLLEGNKEALWLRGLYEEIGRPLKEPTPILGDNKGAIDSAHNPKHHSYIKHTLVRF